MSGSGQGQVNDVVIELLRGFLWTQPLLCADLFAEKCEACFDGDDKVRVLTGKQAVSEYFGLMPPVRLSVVQHFQRDDDVVAQLEFFDEPAPQSSSIILLYSIEHGQIVRFRWLIG